MRDDLVGIDPGGARRVVDVLRDTKAALHRSSRSVQALLDQVDQPSSAPALLRHAARTCGAAAADLERRTGVLSRPGPAPRPWEPAGPSPGACDPWPAVLPPPTTRSTSSIVDLGPSILITPPAPRTPLAVYTTLGGQGYEKSKHDRPCEIRDFLHGANRTLMMLAPE